MLNKRKNEEVKSVKILNVKPSKVEQNLMEDKISINSKNFKDNNIKITMLK